MLHHASCTSSSQVARDVGHLVLLQQLQHLRVLLLATRCQQQHSCNARRLLLLATRCLERFFSPAHPPRGLAQVQVHIFTCSTLFFDRRFWHVTRDTHTHTRTNTHAHTHTHTHTRIPYISSVFFSSFLQNVPSLILVTIFVLFSEVIFLCLLLFLNGETSPLTLASGGKGEVIIFVYDSG